MLVRIVRASTWDNGQPCSKAEFKQVTMYDRRKMDMETLKADKYNYRYFMKEGTKHREEYDEFNKPWCIRELKRNIWVLKIRSLNSLDDLIEEVGAIIIQPEKDYKGIDYTIIIYDGYIE